MPYRTRSSGFTLVELLIVIIVIAILASITIVAYRGVQSNGQLAKLQSDAHTVATQLEIFSGRHTGTYPTSISDCPTPASDADCIQLGSETVSYQAGDRDPSGYSQVNGPGYILTLMDKKQGLLSAHFEFTRSNEFVRTVDLAPMINKYGLKKYQLSFDIKSASSTAKTIQAYMQNGSGARYGGLVVQVPVTNTFSHQTLTFTPNNSNTSLTESYLAFYGVYGTGNIPTVKNIEMTLAN